MRVMVYFNLHRRVWSIKALEGENKGRVIAHSLHFMLADATFKVSEAGRQRVLREKRKNVHAGVVGTLAGLGHIRVESSEGVPVSYNPYRGPAFVRRDNGQPVTRAKWVAGTDAGVFAEVTA